MRLTLHSRHLMAQRGIPQRSVSFARHHEVLTTWNQSQR
jgi:hypothetical protein